MEKCIFCRAVSGFNTREHILPESLGGGDWSLLPNVLVCDSCQNRFGSSIEQQALDDYPFLFFRVMLGIPTKKGKAPWMKTLMGVVKGSIVPGTVGLDPSSAFEQGIVDGQITQMRLPAQPRRADMVCRTLLKMGLEMVAADNPEDVFSEIYDSAREFALQGHKAASWWYLQHEDLEQAKLFLTNGLSFDEWLKNVRLEVSSISDGYEVFHLKLLYINLIVPLRPSILPPSLKELPEPEYRLFIV